jgi:hypothetical protein
MEPFFATLLSILAALGLAAACGFRVFVPLLVVSIASRAGLLHLSEGFAWIGSTPALACLALATALEIGAYYVPVVDNFLDAVATPAAILAGVVVSMAVMEGVDPWLRWTLGVLAGGTAAAVVQIPTVVARGASTTTTGGLANSAVSTGEAAAAGLFSTLAVLWPLAIPLVALAVLYVTYRLFRRRRVPAPIQ